MADKFFAPPSLASLPLPVSRAKSRHLSTGVREIEPVGAVAGQLRFGKAREQPHLIPTGAT